MNKIEVLRNCKVEGNVIKLPTEQLDRKVYLETKKALELIGGKWKGGKTFGFIFANDPSDLLEQIANGKNINLKKEFQFFATPKTLATRLVELADLQPFDKVLEPKAGQGAIVSEINLVYDLVPDCFEIMETNRMILEKSNLKFNLVGIDFLKSNDKEYSKIIANPPFSKNQDIAHVYKMFEKLEKRGRIVTMMSTHWQKSSNSKEKKFRQFLNKIGAEIIDISAGTFKESGTSVSSVIVIINK